MDKAAVIEIVSPYLFDCIVAADWFTVWFPAPFVVISVGGGRLLASFRCVVYVTPGTTGTVVVCMQWAHIVVSMGLLLL